MIPSLPIPLPDLDRDALTLMTPRMVLRLPRTPLCLFNRGQECRRIRRRGGLKRLPARVQVQGEGSTAALARRLRGKLSVHPPYSAARRRSTVP